MQAEVLREALRAHRRAGVAWMIGLAAFLALNIATYPAVKGEADYDKLIQDMPDALLAAFGIDPSLSITSGPGYLVSQVFGFILPLLFVVLAVAFGARAIAGEEEQGTLDLLLAQPISRRSVVVQKLCALAVVVLALGLGSWVVLVAVSPLFDLRAATGSLAIATLASALFGLQAGAIALAVGAASGRRGMAIAVAAAAALAALVIESLAQLTDVFARLRFLSPWYFANGNIPMVHGLRVLDLAVLAGITLLAGLVAAVSFDRRDLS